MYVGNQKLLTEISCTCVTFLNLSVVHQYMQHLFGIPIMNLRLDRLKRCRGQLPGGPAGDGGTPVASAICLTTLSGHPWRHTGSSFP